MQPYVILACILIYCSALVFIGRLTGRDDCNNSFFTGKRQSSWYLVAFGMIGVSISGVSFISVPGLVESSGFGFMQFVLGTLVGYLIIITVLLPLYYRFQLTSIYTWLKFRFGHRSYKTGALLFIISRVIGAAFRLFVVTNVLQTLVFDLFNIPFAFTVFFTLLLIWLYTFRGGIKTIVWTDTVQTFFMLSAILLTMIFIYDQLHPALSFFSYIENNPLSRVIFLDDYQSANYFWKQFIGGIFIAIAMNGLDQDLMQKNLTCRTLKEAQKNMLTTSVCMVLVTWLFLTLGVLLLDFARVHNIAAHGDQLFPAVVSSGKIGWAVTLFFTVGLISSACSSADSAITALTTSFCIDILERESIDQSNRILVHGGFSVLLFITIMLFKYTISDSVIRELFTAASYTYGPLLGLYAFGVFTRRPVNDRWTPYIAIMSPLFCYFFSGFSKIYWGYSFSYELLLFNGCFTCIALYISSGVLAGLMNRLRN